MNGPAAILAAILSASPALGQEVVKYYHLDAIGSVRVVTDHTGAVVERHDYLPFGEECLTPPCTPLQGTNTRKFTGKERDAETGLDYFGARYYGSRIGRFTTVDPYLDQSAALVDPQQWNRYVYGRNNPLKFVDPDGRHPIIIILALAAAFVLNNPTNANITQGPAHDTIVPNSLIVAGGYGLAAGGARMAAKEVFQETVENVTGLPVGGLPSRGASKTATEMADALSSRIGKNSVPFETPSTKGHIDLKGKAHFDKPTGQKIPTPHVQTRPKHVGPQGQVNLGPQTTKSATKADIRTAEKLAERKQQ